MKSPKPLHDIPDPTRFDMARTAFFFDFDGTLADIVDDPWEARLKPAVRDCLAALHEAAGGALAIVSGRPIASLDEQLHPLHLPLAGVHGQERRAADGNMQRAEIDQNLMAATTARVEAFVSEHSGLVAERKPGSVALHYRRRPELADQCRALAEELVGARPGLKLLHGKMVFELKMGANTKADAIAAFMGEAPFAGRRPVFAGDDLTDEDGFRELVRWDGLSIKIGAGPTAAICRVGGIEEFRSWLGRLAKCGLEPV